MSWRDTIQPVSQENNAAPPPSGGWRDTIQPVEDTSHDLGPAIKQAGQGVMSALHTFGTKPLVDIAYDNLIQPAVDTFHRHQDAGENVTQSGLAALAQGTGGVAHLAQGVVAPETLPINTYFDSRDAGNSVGDALKDARNTGTIIAGTGAIGKVAEAGLPIVGRVTDAVAQRAPTAVAAAVGHHFGGLPGALVGGGLGEVAKGITSSSNSVRGILSEGVMTAPIGAADASVGSAIVSAAAQQGPRQAAIAHYLTSQRDPEYAASQQKKDQ